MREIKFKGILKEYSPYAYVVGLLDFTQQEVFLFTGRGHYRSPFKKAVIMQYIGLKDKNNQEIYHKDIVKCKLKNGEEKCGVVEWNEKDLQWQVDLRGGFLPFSEVEEIEVVGNIEENPNLSKKVR